MVPRFVWNFSTRSEAAQRIDRTLAEFDCCLPAAAFFLISVWLLFGYGFACKDARQGPYNDPSTSSRPPVGVVTDEKMRRAQELRREHQTQAQGRLAELAVPLSAEATAFMTDHIVGQLEQQIALEVALTSAQAAWEERQSSMALEAARRAQVDAALAGRAEGGDDARSSFLREGMLRTGSVSARPTRSPKQNSADCWLLATGRGALIERSLTNRPNLRNC
eukprot:COSAG01_NODE_7810_length_3046_cov_26.887343_2_plen_221_part_00